MVLMVLMTLVILGPAVIERDLNDLMADREVKIAAGLISEEAEIEDSENFEEKSLNNRVMHRNYAS